MTPWGNPGVLIRKSKFAFVSAAAWRSGPGPAPASARQCRAAGCATRGSGPPCVVTPCEPGVILGPEWQTEEAEPWR